MYHKTSNAIGTSYFCDRILIEKSQKYAAQHNYVPHKTSNTIGTIYFCDRILIEKSQKFATQQK